MIYQKPKEGVVVAVEGVDVEDTEVSQAGLEAGLQVNNFNFLRRDWP